ncbi:uncharacterized protein [Palaemon carinicauda]|uniref:uncharacterized protein n=1 Tax=Palaemon carinicauda TaxID=392227 RepID=UPI0035B59AF8
MDTNPSAATPEPSLNVAYLTVKQMAETLIESLWQEDPATVLLLDKTSSAPAPAVEPDPEPRPTMLNLKANFRRKYEDNFCDLCTDEEDTTEYLFLCPKLGQLMNVDISLELLNCKTERNLNHFVVQQTTPINVNKVRTEEVAATLFNSTLTSSLEIEAKFQEANMRPEFFGGFPLLVRRLQTLSAEETPENVESLEHLLEDLLKIISFQRCRRLYKTLIQLCVAAKLLVTVEKVREIVANCPKQRFKLEEREAELYIRANQGHSLQVEDLELEEITSDDGTPVIHGTYRKYWESIRKEGLRRMTRNHMHFTSKMPEEVAGGRGIRSSCQIDIYVDLAEALQGLFTS